MATIRSTILNALVARLAAISGWTVQLRGAEQTGNHPVAVVVFMLGEDKALANNLAYQCTMTVGVEISANVADADPDLDDGNPYAYIDRLVAEVEKRIHVPDSWGLTPDFTDVRVDGHDLADPPQVEEFMRVEALVRLTFTYRHSIESPEAA